MYTNYFKLSEPPFSLTPDPRYLFMSERHREGLAHLLFGVQQPGGFVQLTGEIGSGKTTLCRCLIKQLPPDTDVALILNPRLTVIELLAAVCDELRIPYPAATESIKTLIDALNQRLLETHAQRRRTVLIIDEAQNLHSDVLEQIRLLTNLETSQEKLLQIILIGQPELLSILNGKKLRQLAQRITARYHLLALSRQETYAYIQHRLFVAGGREPLFTRTAIRCVYRLSGGVPRVINIICDRALLGAFARDKRKVSASIVRKASRETQGLVPRYRRLRLAWAAGIVTLAAITVGAIFLNLTGRPIWHWWDPAMSSGAASSPRKSLATPSPVSLPNPPPAASIPDAPKAPYPESASAAAKTTLSPRLADILSNPALRGNAASSFASLYALWGVKFSVIPPDLGCGTAAAQGLECLSQEGSWPKLRRFDLPAILETVLPSGARSRATLTKVSDETATLEIGGRQYSFPLTEIDRVWDGSFTLLWKPPFSARQLSYGAQGKEVIWVRHALDRLEGKDPDPAASNLFDDGLRQQVVAFQRKWSLIPDGCIGQETLARLAAALEGPGAPSISRHAR